jgi:hypothetical protein
VGRAETAKRNGTTLGSKPNNPLRGTGAYNPDLVPVTSPHQNPANLGSTLVKDEATGFLVPGPSTTGNPVFHFNAEKKIRFLELAMEHWPNIFKVCNEVKVHYGTYKNHLIIDEKFAQCMDDIKQAKVDHVEGNVFTFANRPANFMDRMAILRAYRGDLYNPVNKVQHLGHELSKDDVLRKRANLATVVDAEVVKASGEVLDAEIVPTQPGVPVDAEVPVQSPSGSVPGIVASFGGESDARPRDPLSELMEE